VQRYNNGKIWKNMVKQKKNEINIIIYIYYSNTPIMSLKSDKASNYNLYRKMVKALRHGRNFRNGEMNPDGFVLLSVIHRIVPSTEALSIADLLDIVENCAKHRCSMIERDGQYFIRANQGHSAEVAEKSKLDPRKICELITVPLSCFHGTFQTILDKIHVSGLSRMSRQHIHLATAIDAKSGARKNCNVRIYINMAQAMADGIQFYMSTNGVVLTEGIDGILAPKYFSRIEIL